MFPNFWAAFSQWNYVMYRFTYLHFGRFFHKLQHPATSINKVKTVCVMPHLHAYPPNLSNFPNWTLLPRRPRYLDFRQIRKKHSFYVHLKQPLVSMTMRQILLLNLARKQLCLYSTKVSEFRRIRIYPFFYEPAPGFHARFWIHNHSQDDQGPMLWFFKYFRRKNCKKWAFLTQNKAKLCKILIITLVFEKNANFFAEN
jgi:hypothetical protein